MGRYTLKINGEPINEYTKVRLLDIDKFTTNFASVGSILEALNKNDIKGIKNLKISYRMYEKEKELDVALDSKKDLQYVDVEATGNINYTNRVFVRYASKFCEKTKNDNEFYVFVMKSPLLNEKLKQYIQLNHGSNNIFYENKIKEYLGSYLQFRNVLFLLEEYEWLKMEEEFHKQKTEVDSEKKHYTGFEEENLTEEEIKKYQEYLDNLPDNEPDYFTR